MAGHLGLMGFSVNLFNRREVGEFHDLRQIRSQGGIKLEGSLEGFGKLNVISTDIKEVIHGTNVIMVVVPANAHESVAEVCAPHLSDGQIIVLNPGRTGGALEFRNVLEKKGVSAKVKIVEAQTLIYASRSTGPADSKVHAIKREVPVAALPTNETRSALEVLNLAYPQFVASRDVLETSLGNMGAVLHPVLTLLNAGRIESTKGDYDFYTDGATPYVCNVIETVDKERLMLAKALDTRATPLLQWLNSAYGVEAETVFEALQKNPAYKGIRAPENLNNRFIFEDVPTGLVPFASLGEMLNVPTPLTKALIELASTMFATNFWNQGRTLRKLGLEGLTVSQIKELVAGKIRRK
jgi:opine dehydrogenase